MKIKSASINKKIFEEAEGFFADNRQAIADYAGQEGLIFEPGEKWTIDFSTGRGTFDAMYFYRNGFSYAESMWAVCREIENIKDRRRDPKAYADVYRMAGRGKRRLLLLYRRLNDIFINRELDRRFPAHIETRRHLYEYRIIPLSDQTARAKHLQFISAILREKMLPDEKVTVSPDVRKEIDKLKNIDSTGTNLIELLSDRRAAPGERFGLIRDYIEPVFERFFREDVEANRGKAKRHGRESVPEGDFFEGSTDGKKAEEYFASEYDEESNALPETFSADQMQNALEQESQRRLAGEKSPEQIAREQFKALHGVTPEEMEDFSDQYKKISHNIEPLRQIFEKIIETRKEIRRRLKERTDHGVIIDPSLFAQAYIDAYGGVADSRTQLKIRKEELDEQKPLDFEFTLICDLSGSMSGNIPGGKSYEQRLCAILIAEALDEFENKLKSERQGRMVDLRVFSEIRGFGAEDEVLKPMSCSIDYYTRVKICRRLEACVGRRTADYKSLQHVSSTVGTAEVKRIKDGTLKKAAVLITDGGSTDAKLARDIKNQLISKGVVARAIQIGDTVKDDVDRFNYAWGGDGLPCRDVSRLVITMEKLLEELLADL